MSSLPLISHHLFVSAIGSEEPSAPGPKSVPDRQEAKPIPLEVIEYNQETSIDTARPLRRRTRLNRPV